ncbi:MAG: FtsX-like permease family protein [Spirosomataceae bacterium]
MLFNYLKIALRNLWRHKLYSSLTVSGLAVGLAACLLMFLYFRHELSYDTFYKNADRIARITIKLNTPEAPVDVALSPILLAPLLSKDYPEVEKTARLMSMAATVKYKDKLLNEPEVYYTDQDVFSVFSYSFIHGSAREALSRPNTMVVTESFAKKYAGQTDIVGTAMQINKEFYRITGVIADLPSNTDLKINVLLSYDFSKPTTWLGDLASVYTFALFYQTPNLPVLLQKLNKFSRQTIQPEFKKAGEEDYSLEFKSEMLADVHYSQGNIEDTPKGNRQYGYLFLFLGLFVLAVALLNYISLLTARATERAKEVGVRKATGAQRVQLIGQFLFESLLISFFSVVISLLLVEISLPVLNTGLGIHLQISGNETGVLSGMGLLITTLLGGAYPAFVLSGFRPMEVLRGAISRNGRALGLRQVITTFQFVLTAGMIVGVLVIYRQMNFLQKHYLGFDKNQVLVVSLPVDSLARTRGIALANSLRQRSEISDITVGSGLEPDAMGNVLFSGNGKKRELMTRFAFIDDRFIPLLGMKLATGRNLSPTNVSDKNAAFLVNEAFVKMSGWKNPISQPIEGFGRKGQVIGVVKDFNYHSLHNAVEPLVMVYTHFPPNSLMLKMIPEQLPMVKATWQSHYPDFPFEYHFLDTVFDEQYRKDRLMMQLFNAFAFLTILVACVGLFSLVTFTTEIRTKEIGIRKVLGASVLSITALLSKDFLKLVVIAVVIASPVAWYAMNQWLAGFAYRIEITWWVFAVAGILTLLIALLTVSLHSIKAALMNPVKSLKTE